MQSTQLDNFLMIIECGSINKAAQRLFMSQPTLSQQLRQLEEEVGADLFVREGRRLVLTPAGKILEEYAIKQNNCLKKALYRINAMKYGTNEAITIGIAQTSLIHDVAKWVGIMNEKHSNVSYQFINFAFMKLLELMKDEQIDIMFTRQIASDADFLANYEYRAIKSHAILAVLPPKMQWNDEFISLKDIDGKEVIIRGKHDKRFIEKCSEYDSVPIVKSMCRNNILKLELVKNNVGIGFFFDSIVDTDLFKIYNLKYCKVKEISVKNTTYVVYPKAKKNATTIKNLLDTIFDTKI